jgi:hypothetical protein
MLISQKVHRIDLIDWFWFLVFNATFSNIQLYHGDQFVCQTNMHLIMWIENAFKFCGKLIHFYKEWISFLFFLWRWKMWGCQLTFIECRGSQTDLSFNWCLQVSVVPLKVRWFLEDFPLSFIFNTWVPLGVDRNFWLWFLGMI